MPKETQIPQTTEEGAQAGKRGEAYRSGWYGWRAPHTSIVPASTLFLSSQHPVKGVSLHALPGRTLPSSL